MSEDTKFKPGQSGNPRGRPRAATQLARMIRDQTEDGAELVRRVLAIARGLDRAAEDAKSIRWALDWLADRTFGKPQQTIEIVGSEQSPPPDYSVLTDEEAEWYERITAKLMLTIAPRVEDADGGSSPVH